MGDEHTWRRVLEIISRYKHPLVIVSATARTTRQLLAAAEKALHNRAEARKMANEIGKRHHQLVANFVNYYPRNESAAAEECKLWINEKIAELEGYLSQINEEQKLDEQLKDAVASIGEQLSSYLFAKCGMIYGLPARWLDAGDIIRTDSNFGQASPDTAFINLQAGFLRENLQSGDIPIMGGYYGQDKKGKITTLGFEGSDYTASLMGAALSAEAIEIWTDVSGIYTCDPHMISGARSIPELSFQEATELAYFGAKVLHPSTMNPASQQQIPVYVKNIFEPDHPGTRIAAKAGSNGRAKAITFKENCVTLTVTSANAVMGYEFLAGVFQSLKAHHLPVDVVTTTEASVSIALGNSSKVEKAVQQLKKQGSVDMKRKRAVISLIGCNSSEIHSLVNDMLAGIGDETVSLISFSRSKKNLNVVLDQESVLASVQAIHKSIFE